MSLPDPNSLRAVLLDLDDTILDDRSGIRATWDSVTRLVCRAHPQLAESVLRSAISRSADWFWSEPERERAGRLDLHRTRRLILETALAELGVSDSTLAARAARRYAAERERRYRPAEGAIEALRQLRRRLPWLALVTNGAAEPQRGKIERFDLAGYFDHIVVEGEFGMGKPEAGVFRHVMAVLDVQPEQCLMVGDNHRADVVGALAVGMHAAWIDVDERGAPPQPAPRPHATVRSLADLSRQLGF